MPPKKVTTTHIRRVNPSTETSPGTSHGPPNRVRATSAATLAANSVHTIHVSATGTSGDAALVSGSAPVVGLVGPAVIVRGGRPISAFDQGSKSGFWSSLLVLKNRLGNKPIHIHKSFVEMLLKNVMF